MRAYVLDDKNQDISYIPVDSFVYYDGCGFVKHSQSIRNWDDVDTNSIECTSNDTLNPVVKSADQEISLQSAEIIKFVVHGAFTLDKGATITEISFIDVLGNKIPYDLSNFEDVQLSNPGNWNNTDGWEGANLFDRNETYATPEDGPISSTIFNLGADYYNKDSVFYIRLSPEQMKNIAAIKILAGSPEGRIPVSISVYAVKNKDDIQTRIETLVWYRAFSNAIDGNRPAQAFTATQQVRAEDPCLELYMNGETEDGVKIVMNPYTGNLTTIYCKFPETIEYKDPNDPDYSDYMKRLCGMNPDSIILVKDMDNIIKNKTVREFLAEENWVCEMDGCEGLYGSEYLSCMDNICLAQDRNQNTVIKFFDENLNLIQKNVGDYLLSKNYTCNKQNNDVFISDSINSTDTTVDLTSNIDTLIANGEGGTLISLIDPATGEIVKVTPLEYKTMNDTTSNEISIENNMNQLLSEGYTEVPSDKTCYRKFTNGIDIKYVKLQDCTAPVTVYSDNTKNTTTKIDITNLIQENNINLNDISTFDSKGNISFHIEREIQEVPKLDVNGDIILNETELKEFVYIVFDVVNPNAAGTTSDLIITDGNNTLNINLDIHAFELQIFEKFKVPSILSQSLMETESGKYKKSIEYDESGAIINFYGSETVNITGYSDKLIVEIVYGKTKDGYIKIKPNITAAEITEGLHREILTITNGSEIIELTIDITKHMRIGSQDNKSYEFDYGEIIVDEGEKSFHIFNIDNKPPITKTPAEMYSYLINNGNSAFDKAVHPLDRHMGTCYQPGLKTHADGAEIILNPYREQLNERKFYIVDPYFNEENADQGLIDPNQVRTIAIKYTVNKFMTINGKTSDFSLTIDKYRFINSKTNFVYSEPNNFRDLKIMHQTEGLNISISNPNVVGIKKGDASSTEFNFFNCRNGGALPKLFTLLTGDKYTELGSSVLTFTDTESSLNVTVNVIQYLDIGLNYNNGYTLPTQLIGTTATISLLHPYDNNWENLIFWTDDDVIVEGNINKIDNVLELTFNKIGSTAVYITDQHRTYKINVSSNYDTTLTPEYTAYKLLSVDTETKNINIFNSKGILSIDFDNTLIDASIDDANKILSFKNIAEIPFSTTVTITDTVNTGNQITHININSIDPSNWIITKDATTNLSLSLAVDTSEVYFEIENPEENI